MAQRLYDEDSVKNIANAIRAKNGSTETYNIDEMPTAIEKLSGASFEIDSELSSNSENPVQNKVIKAALDKKQDIIQYSVMPEASEAYSNKIVQYVGKTAGSYTRGYFYQCIKIGSWAWIEISVSKDYNKMDKPDTISSVPRLVTYSLTGGTGIAEINKDMLTGSYTSDSIPTADAVKDYVDDNTSNPLKLSDANLQKSGLLLQSYQAAGSTPGTVGTTTYAVVTRDTSTLDDSIMGTLKVPSSYAVGNYVKESISAEQSRADNTFSNALKGSKNGGAFLINDISPITHEMGVKVSSNTAEDLTTVKVRKQGKNLIPFPYQQLTLGTSTDNGVDFTVYKDGSILINGTATEITRKYLYRNTTDLLGLKSGITISVSKNASDDTQQGNIHFMCNYYNSTGTMVQGVVASTTPSGTKIITDAWKGLGICIHIPKGKTLNNLLIKPQLEIGATATKYESYIVPTEYIPATNGTVNGITSLYPNTTLTTDTEGVIIDCEYNVDLNKGLNIPSIDQTYTPSSENAQSGIAVAEAFERKTTTTPEQETAALGDELVSSVGWTTDGWTGDLINGFTHTSGNTSSLIFEMPEDTGTNVYRISFKCSSEIASKALMVKCGNSELFDLYGQSANPLVLGIQSISNGNIEFVPTSTFTGTISEISIKKVLNGFEGSYKLKDSQNLTSFELRGTKYIQNNLFIGRDSGMQNISGYGCVGLGVNALKFNTSGFWNVGVGFNALFNNTVGSRNIGIGYIALQSNITGSRNIGIGSFSLKSNTTGDKNISIGADSMDHNISGYENIAIGFSAMYNNNSGYHNIALGSLALQANTSAFNNVAIGYSALNGVKTASYNIGIGAHTLKYAEGVGNVAIGDSALQLNKSKQNVAIGYNAGKGKTGATFERLVAIGAFSGIDLTTGNGNVFIGFEAGKSTTTGGYNILIGYQTKTPTKDTSRYLNIGNLITGSMEPSARYVKIQSHLDLPALQVVDPHIPGRVWNDNGTLKVSAG